MDINSTLASEPMILGITSMVNTVKILVGGVFGFYILMAIWRFYTYKKNRTFFKKLRRDIVRMTHSLEELQGEVNGLKRENKSKITNVSRIKKRNPKRKKK